MSAILLRSKKHGNRVVHFDYKDSRLVGKYTWVLKKGRHTFYAVAFWTDSLTGRPHQIRMHRLILKAKPGVLVDHINHDGLNNRRYNIRLASRSNNQWNSVVNRRNNTSGYKGVVWHKQRNKWMAQISVRGRVIHLGLFASARAAARAYNSAAIHHFGKFSLLNKL